MFQLFKTYSGVFRFLIPALLVILLALVVYLLFFQQKQTTIESGEPIITELRKLQRYEASAFTIEQIIEAGDQGNRFQEILFGDRILLIAHGEVIAGFDLSGLSEDDIDVSGNSVTLTLPAPMILLTRLDSEKTRVYDRDQGLLTQGDKDLESEARLSAEQTIQQAACDGGILEAATENARSQFTALIKAFGFTSVTVEIPRGTC